MAVGGRPVITLPVHLVSGSHTTTCPRMTLPCGLSNCSRIKPHYVRWWNRPKWPRVMAAGPAVEVRVERRPLAMATRPHPPRDPVWRRQKRQVLQLCKVRTKVVLQNCSVQCSAMITWSIFSPNRRLNHLCKRDVTSFKPWNSSNVLDSKKG